MELPSGAFIMIWATIAGIITAVVALVSMIISKEQKISEYRESRRRRIRQEAAQYLAQIDTLFKLYECELKSTKQNCLTDMELQKFRCSHKENIYQLFEMRHRLFLRLTPERSPKLKESLESIDQVFFGTSFCEDTLHIHRDSIIKEVQGILRYEWKRVKSGEPDYQKTEKTSKTAIKCLLLFLIVLFGYGTYIFFKS
ncbi:hypothetical protein [Paraglaciecola polaris]|uniref:Uncharacterized protein n=1 Tax=Paraglaciecola polaris LMG 21857 TaxID=1129793 RepID=K6ZV07_9ALTE|nr:hypothetical protein [Paraglaciecola polaris]GAC32628.1 hypothetical protein GPLA_1718 [Paraglaciecola polaris LMG 21857]